ncbi:MAG: BON domain-containing protein [Nitrospirales bacterium]
MTKVILAFSVSLAIGGGVTGCSTSTHEQSPPSRPAVSHKEVAPSSPAVRKGVREGTRGQTTTRETPPANRPAPSETEPAVAPDDTGRNVRDRDAKTLTPMDQSSDAGDVEITRRIRQALMADDTLSITAKNIKIITVHGTVTLRGPVETAGERLSIFNKANTVANGRVDNQLEVTSR